MEICRGPVSEWSEHNQSWRQIDNKKISTTYQIEVCPDILLLDIFRLITTFPNIVSQTEFSFEIPGYYGMGPRQIPSQQTS